MTAWIELTSGIFVHLDRIEGIVPQPAGGYRFYPPRAQRGGRPTGRPTERVSGYDEDRNYWEGVPVDEIRFLQLLRGTAWTGWRTRDPRWTEEAAQKPQDGVEGTGLGLGGPDVLEPL